MKEIPLTQNKFALVDDEDYELVSKHKWQAIKPRGNYTWYAKTDIGGKKHKKSLKMHRFILNASKQIHVDHIDGNGLNNQKSNLRLVTPQFNQANCKPKKGKSFYKGVSKRKDLRFRIWRATITYNRKQIHLGYFETDIEAAIVYDQKAIDLFGSYARLNFPKKII